MKTPNIASNNFIKIVIYYNLIKLYNTKQTQSAKALGQDGNSQDQILRAQNVRISA